MESNKKKNHCFLGDQLFKKKNEKKKIHETPKGSKIYTKLKVQPIRYF